mmetsp:Transcript_79429/g.133018  ORF Transcript_79429/g.133018 Transcript_79429/m.133018 type:complete len:205 (-) Transcript_79429:368-982(-)
MTLRVVKRLGSSVLGRYSIFWIPWTAVACTFARASFGPKVVFSRSWALSASASPFNLMAKAAASALALPNRSRFRASVSTLISRAFASAAASMPTTFALFSARHNLFSDSSSTSTLSAPFWARISPACFDVRSSISACCNRRRFSMFFSAELFCTLVAACSDNCRRIFLSCNAKDSIRMLFICTPKSSYMWLARAAMNWSCTLA